MLRIAYGRLRLQPSEFWGMSWFEFNCAVEGYIDELRLEYPGIKRTEQMNPPTDEEVRKVKKSSEKWIKFFRRPTLKAQKHG